jgi:hypothetical protein
MLYETRLVFHMSAQLSWTDLIMGGIRVWDEGELVYLAQRQSMMYRLPLMFPDSSHMTGMTIGSFVYL